jgi:hypothetical protein
MASYSVNEPAVARARQLIEARQYVLASNWGEIQPQAAEENAFLESHSWDDYAEWHLGLTDGAADETKARYAFVYRDFRRVHRSGLIACHFGLRSGVTRPSSSRPTISCSISTLRAPDLRDAAAMKPRNRAHFGRLKAPLGDTSPAHSISERAGEPVLGT